MDEYSAHAASYQKLNKPKPPEMPQEAEMEKPFILYLDSLNRVNTNNM